MQVKSINNSLLESSFDLSFEYKTDKTLNRSFILWVIFFHFLFGFNVVNLILYFSVPEKIFQDNPRLENNFKNNNPESKNNEVIQKGRSVNSFLNVQPKFYQNLTWNVKKNYNHEQNQFESKIDGVKFHFKNVCSFNSIMNSWKFEYGMMTFMNDKLLKLYMEYKSDNFSIN